MVPWLLRMESKASLVQFVKLLKAGVAISPWQLFRAQKLLEELSDQGFEDAKHLLDEL